MPTDNSKEYKPKGVHEKNFGRSAVPKWNFHKIIIGKDGKIKDTFASITNPSSKKFIKAIEEYLD